MPRVPVVHFDFDDGDERSYNATTIYKSKSDHLDNRPPAMSGDIQGEERPNAMIDKGEERPNTIDKGEERPNVAMVEGEECPLPPPFRLFLAANAKKYQDLASTSSSSSSNPGSEQIR